MLLVAYVAAVAAVAAVIVVGGVVHTFQMYIIIYTVFRSLAHHKREWERGARGK